MAVYIHCISLVWIDSVIHAQVPSKPLLIWLEKIKRYLVDSIGRLTFLLSINLNGVISEMKVMTMILVQCKVLRNNIPNHNSSNL